MERHLLDVTAYESPRAAVDEFKEKYGPTIAVMNNIGDDAARQEEFDAAYMAFAESQNLAGPGEPARFQYEYLLVVGTKA